MFSILLLLIFPQFLKSQYDFDRYLEQYDSFVRIWVFGFENIGNRGISRGCCFARNNSICTPCRYRVSFRVRQYEPITYSSFNYYYDLGTFSRASESLFQTFYFEKMFSWLYMDDNDLNFYVTERFTTNPVETTEKMLYYWYGDYQFDGAFGIFNRMRTWIVMSFINNGYRETSNINVILQSIVFNQYKLTTGGCCTGEPDEQDESCLTPCNFLVLLNNGRRDLVSSRDIEALRSSRRYTYNLTLAYLVSTIVANGGSLYIRFITTKDKNEMDTIELRNLNLYRKRTYYFNNMVGNNGYIRANISINLNCVGSAGRLCSRTCREYKNVDSCDNPDGVPICLNRATDARLCQNYTLSCENNPCLNNGTCKFVNNNRLACVCEEGFSGIYCEEINCKFNCRSRGLCVSPNKCMCEYPFFGDDCEFQVCNASTTNICQNGGTCYYDNLVPKCRCDDDRYSGTFCEIPVCSQTCINGVCIRSPSRIGNNKCICYEGFTGPTCEIISSRILPSNNSAVLPLLVILAIGTTIMFVLIFLKYKGILFKPYINGILQTDGDL